MLKSKKSKCTHHKAPIVTSNTEWSGAGVVFGWWTETQKPQPPFKKNKPVLFESQLVHYTPLTSGSFPFWSSSGHTVPPTGDHADLWHTWPWPQIQQHLSPGALFHGKPTLWPQMDNNMAFTWRTSVFCILRDILLGLALPIVKISIIIQPHGEMLSNCRQYEDLKRLSYKYFRVIQWNNIARKYMEMWAAACSDCPTE